MSSKITALTASAGALALASTAVSIGRWRSSLPPPDWVSAGRMVPQRRASLMGPLRPSPRSWSLDHGVSWISQQPAQAIELTAELPPYGRLLIFPDAQAATAPTLAPGPVSSSGFRAAQDITAGDALVLERGGPQDAAHGRAYGVRQQGSALQDLSCQGSLPPPTDSPYGISLQRTSTGFEASSGGHHLSCSGSGPRNPMAQRRAGRVALHSGLPTVRISSLRLDGEQTPPPLGAWVVGLFALLGASLGAAADRFQLHDGASRRLRLGLGLVLLATLPLLAMDLRRPVEGLRLADVDPDILAAGLAPSLALGVVCLAAIARAAGRTRSDIRSDLRSDLRSAVPAHRRVGSVLLRAGLFSSIVAGCCAGGTWAAAAGWLFLAALALALTVALNRSTAKPLFINLGSLLLVAALLWTAELGLRASPLSLAWSADSAQHSPSDNQLASLPPRNAPLRIVAMGGSTTGGALGQPDRRGYYPAVMSRSLTQTQTQPQTQTHTQVVNAGVAGWTTWQIRRALATRLAALDPDVLLLYIGYNDAMVMSSRRFSQSVPAGPAHSVSTALSAALSQLRLYQGLRAAINTGLGRRQGVAVTPADSRDNLLAIIATLQPRKTRLLVVSEATWPPSSELAETTAALHEVIVASPGTHWLSATPVLDAPQDFIDDCHLTAAGHQALADAILAQLRALRWLP